MKQMTRMSYWFAVVASLCLFIVVISTSIDGTMRTVFSSGLAMSVEICQLMLIAVAFLGLAWAEIQGTHVRMDAVYEYIPQWAKVKMNFFAHIVYLLTLLFLSYTSILIAMEQLAAREAVFAGTGQIPVWPFRFVLALGVVILLAVVLVETVRSAKLVLHRVKKGD